MKTRGDSSIHGSCRLKRAMDDNSLAQERSRLEEVMRTVRKRTEDTRRLQSIFLSDSRYFVSYRMI